MQTSPNRPSSITRKTRLTSIIRLTRPNCLNRLTSIASKTGKTRLTRPTSLGRMTSCPGRLCLKGREGFLVLLVIIVISELIIQVRLDFLEILRILFSGMGISPGSVRKTRLPMATW